jgi:D-alanyl-D-alanine endopeptidase (penicillin-binding protein 7)
MVMMKKLFVVWACMFCVELWAMPSVWLYNKADNLSPLSENIAEVRPIASLTKVMTAMVILDQQSNMMEPLKLKRTVSSRLPPGTYTRQELLESMIVGSDNAAAETLAENSIHGRQAFIDSMNKKAQELAMYHTVFDDPSGLSRNNVGTATEVGIMITAAHRYSFIKHASTLHQVVINQSAGKKVKHIQVGNTNRNMLHTFKSITVSKTGFTNPAGFCVGLLVENNGIQYVIVVLGATNKNRRLDIVQKIMYNYITATNNSTQLVS